MTPQRLESLPAFRSALEGVSAIGVVLLPKCPMCLMAYASMFSGLGVERLPLNRAWPLLAAVMASSLALTGYRAWRRQRLPRFAVALLGALTMTAARWFDAPRAVALLGFVVLAAGLTWTRWRLPPKHAVVPVP